MRLERVHVAFASGDRPAAPVHPNAPVENADGRVVRADVSTTLPQWQPVWPKSTTTRTPTEP